MSDRDRFVEVAKPRWERLEVLLLAPRRSASEWSELSRLYRAVCADLARAQSLRLSQDVQRYLDQLASRAHNAVYGARQRDRSGPFAFVFRDIPREIRAQRWLVLVAALLFYGPFALGLVGAWLSEDFAVAVLPPDQLASMEQMYSASVGREGGQDAMMAGFYVYNNVGIAFRCFATGIFAGLGTLFFLLYNGLVIGTVFGYLGQVGQLRNLLEFTAGHSAWELNGIVLGGAAGLRMGLAVVLTQGRTRVGSLRAAAPSLYRLVMGAAVMLLVAASIEGFWSASPVPFSVKLAFGAAQVLIVALWWVFGGRGARA